MTTAEWIRAGRKAMGCSQAALGEKAGVSQVQVSLWETGKARPSSDQLSRLEALLGAAELNMARGARTARASRDSALPD